MNSTKTHALIMHVAMPSLVYAGILVFSINKCLWLFVTVLLYAAEIFLSEPKGRRGVGRNLCLFYCLILTAQTSTSYILTAHSNHFPHRSLFVTAQALPILANKFFYILFRDIILNLTCSYSSLPGCCCACSASRRVDRPAHVSPLLCKAKTYWTIFLFRLSHKIIKREKNGK